MEYDGPRLPARDGDTLAEAGNVYVFRLNRRESIDGSVPWNLGRHANHSCAPNCEANEENGRIFIDTLRAVRPGEELTYDYNLILDEPHTPAVKRAHPCFCGAGNCRGTILAKKR